MSCEQHADCGKNSCHRGHLNDAAQAPSLDALGALIAACCASARTLGCDGVKRVHVTAALSYWRIAMRQSVERQLRLAPLV